MDCDVAREALSARIDGEREPVPPARVDEHLERCLACSGWYLRVAKQAEELRWMAGATRPRFGVITTSIDRQPTPAIARDRTQTGWERWALALVGLAQLALGAAQALGVDIGMHAAFHHETSGVHLLNESTAWSLALGAVMIAAAVRPATAAGLAGVLIAFTGVLTLYVIIDLMSGVATPTRVLSHLPLVLGALLAVGVHRSQRGPQRPAPRGAGRPYADGQDSSAERESAA
ncbi:zf-HC2 domain-containing protein [Mycolicibacterium elephantis]